MKCPKEIRECPNGWTDCNLCAFKQQCDDGTYTPELEENELEVDLGIAIKDFKEPVQGERQEVGKIRRTWAEHFMALSPGEALKEFYSKHTPDLHHKDPLPLDGGVVHGGGSSNKAAKKPPKKIPEYLKTWGT